MRNLLFYVSGHGYGHATRSSEVVRTLARRQRQCQVHVRSNVPEHLFAGIERTKFHRLPDSLDPGVVEHADSLGIDVAATLATVEEYHRRRKALIAREVAWLRAHQIALIVADFPPLAGEIAAEYGVPCIGIGNFTWDWIYEPLTENNRSDVQEWLRDGYRQMSCWLKLPFSHEANRQLFPRVVDVPLVARRPHRDVTKVLEELAIASSDRRPRVLLAMRGRIPRESRAAAARTNPDMLFLHFEESNTGEPNEIAVRLGAELAFPDVLSVADAVVSKFGYGIVSECIAGRKRLLCPPRSNFREDEIFVQEAPGQLRVATISQADFRAGRWSQPLGALLAQPVVEPTLSVDGAEVCGGEITKWIEHGIG